MICMFNFPCPFTFTYFLNLLLNSCNGNDAFWHHSMLVKQSSSFSRKHRILSLHICIRQTVRLWHQRHEAVINWHMGKCITKTWLKKQLVNGESSYVQVWGQKDITLNIYTKTGSFQSPNSLHILCHFCCSSATYLWTHPTWPASTGWSKKLQSGIFFVRQSIL